MRCRQSGFSIVELMIAVAIIGMLAALALPAFVSYIRTSKTSEAMGNLRKIYEGEIAYYFTTKSTRAGVAITPQFMQCPSTPDTPPAGIKVSGDWSVASWEGIQFSQDSPVYFSYTADTAGTGTTSSFTARAEGDLDGDGISSLFERTGEIDAATGDPVGAAGIYASREIE